MECLADELVYLYLQGSVQGASRSSVRRHIEECSSCRRTVAEVARSLEDEAPPSVPAQPQLAEASRVGRYELLQRIGAGTGGVVFRARDPELGRDVALKVLRPDAGADVDAARRRLTREAKAMARLSHPNVVTVFDAGVQDQQVFLAMELVDGRNLEDWLTSETRSIGDVLDIFTQAGAGLAAAHDAGLVHRDFKPANVMVGLDGRARVTDFGLAQPALGERSPDASSDSVGEIASRFATMTHTGSFGGTPAFMAPEVFRGQPADARSDQYSFCVALYRSIYGQFPASSDNVRELVTAVIRGDLRWPPNAVSKSIESVLRKGLALSNDARFPSMKELVASLTAEREALRPRTSRRLPKVLVLVGAAVLLFGISAAIQLGTRDSHTTDVVRRTLPAAPLVATPDPDSRTAPTSAPATASAQTTASAPAAPTSNDTRGRARVPVSGASRPSPTVAPGPKQPADRDALLPDPWKPQ